MMRWIAVLGASAVLAGSGLCAGQNALGDGSALDANRQVGSGGKNRPVRDLDAEIRFRNAIVTGNAPGGLSFRGDVGYTAVGEFQGALGTDALFRFRRDSLYSGLANYGIRGTEALQHQFALTTGTRPPAGLSGSLAVSRGGGGTGADLRLEDPFDASAEAPDQGLAALRSVSAFTSGRALQPVVLSVGDVGGGRVVGFSASPLRSIWAEQYDLKAPTGAEAASADNAQASNRNGYAEIRARLEAYNAKLLERDEQEAPLTWRARVEQMLSQLYGGEGEEGEEEAAAQREEALRLLREGPGVVEALVPPEATAEDFYARQMRTGERYLSEGRYFAAEEWFTRALATRPGDEMAQVGRVHAELGAGLLISAATNLRTLLLEHPELAGVRYGEELLPPEARRVELAAVLGEHVERETAMAAESALLLAYIGYQSGREEWVRAGAGYMRAHTEVEPLFALLAAVWDGPGPDGK